MRNRARDNALGADRSPPCGRFTPIADKRSMALLTQSGLEPQGHNPNQSLPLLASRGPQRKVTRGVAD
jgi:hypothetical protein